MKYIAQVNADGFCYSVGQFPDERQLREGEVDVTENPHVTGMYYREGQWVESEEAPEPTQLDAIEETQLTMMEAMADQYEESQAQQLVNMEVLATVYEELMALKGEA